jgi:predicted RNA-binding protein with TRAM domain
MTGTPSLSVGDIVKVTLDRKTGDEPIAVIDGWSIHVEGATVDETVIAQVTAIPGEVRCETLQPVDSGVKMVDLGEHCDQQAENSNIQSASCSTEETDDDYRQTMDNGSTTNEESSDHQLAPSGWIKDEQKLTSQKEVETSSEQPGSVWIRRKAEMMSKIASRHD